MVRGLEPEEAFEPGGLIVRPGSISTLNAR